MHVAYMLYSSVKKLSEEGFASHVPRSARLKHMKSLTTSSKALVALNS